MRGSWRRDRSLARAEAPVKEEKTALFNTIPINVLGRRRKLATLKLKLRRPKPNDLLAPLLGVYYRPA